MNPFVNPNKRSITLPAGFKDLIDVLNQKENEKDAEDEAIRRFIYVLLFQAKQDHATELVIGKALPSGKTPIRYKVKQTWHELAPFPSHIRPNVISELGKMAKFAIGQIAGQGAFDLCFGRSSRTRWVVEMAGADDECRLVCVRG
jgi:hypothetical protein